MHFAFFEAVACADCGFVQYFAEPSARENLAKIDSGWRKM
jgi:hypothetical protein